MSPPVVTGGPLVATGGLRWVASTGNLVIRAQIVLFKIGPVKLMESMGVYSKYIIAWNCLDLVVSRMKFY